MADSSIGPNDVLLGRGGATNGFSGNKRFRTIVSDHQLEYLSARKKEKAVIARKIVALVHESGGRFLRKDSSDTWVEVPVQRAREKTSQALREGLDVRNRTTRPNKLARRYSINRVPAEGDKVSISGRVVSSSAAQMKPSPAVVSLSGEQVPELHVEGEEEQQTSPLEKTIDQLPHEPISSSVEHVCEV